MCYLPSKVTSLSKAPALFILTGICSAIMLYDAGLPFIVSPLIGGVLSFGMILFSSRGTVKGFWAFSFLILILSVSMGYFSLFRLEQNHVENRYVRMKGHVLSERAWGGRRAIILSLDGNRYMAKVSPEKGYSEGDTLFITGYIIPMKSSLKNPGGFREDMYWKAKGVKGEYLPESMKLLSSSGKDIHSWRSYLRREILLSLPEKTRGYMLASWLGAKDPDLVQIHSTSGTVHLLAVSGFHVAILASGLFLIFRNFPACNIIISLFLWLYVALTGFAPSASRASMMLQLVLISRFFGRPVTPINSVSVAGVIMLSLNPFCFWDLGWRLSMVASLTISAFIELEFHKRIKVLLISPIVWLSTSALIISSFGQVPLSGMIFNLFTIPLFGILLPLASIISVLVLLGVPFADLFSFACEIPFLAWENVAHFFCFLFPYSTGSNWLVITTSVLTFFTVILRSISYNLYRSISASCVVIIFLAFLYKYIVV